MAGKILTHAVVCLMGVSDLKRALRLAHELSEGERLRRWRQRMEFEELEHTERMRRYQHMSEVSVTLYTTSKSLCFPCPRMIEVIDTFVHQ